MAGIIVADTIQSGGSFIRLNSASQTVATINASGIYANTGNLLIAANGTIGVASITNTAITGTITQAQIGTGVGSTGPSFSATRSGTQTFSNSVFTKVNFNVEDWDTNSCYDNSTNYRFTPNVAGYYHVSLSLSWSFTSGGISFAALYKNGSAWKYGPLQPATGSGCIGNLTALVYLNGTTDYIEAYAYQNQGTNNIATGTGETYFQVAFVRAA